MVHFQGESDSRHGSNNNNNMEVVMTTTNEPDGALVNSTSVKKYKENTALGRFNNVLFSESMQEYISDTLRDKRGKIADLCSIVSNNPKLQECDPSSIIFSWLKSVELGLSLNSNLGLAHLVPYSGKAQFQIGYKGLYQLAMRTGEYLTINVADIRTGELLNYDPVKDIYEFKFADSSTRDSISIVGYCAYLKMRNGFEKTLYWSINKIRQHGKQYSKMYNYSDGLWQKNFDAMARKTVLKSLLSKWGLLSIDLEKAISYDQAVFEKDTLKYIDNPADEMQNKGINALESGFGIVPSDDVDRPPTPEENAELDNDFTKKEV